MSQLKEIAKYDARNRTGVMSHSYGVTQVSSVEWKRLKDVFEKLYNFAKITNKHLNRDVLISENCRVVRYKDSLVLHHGNKEITFHFMEDDFLPLKDKLAKVSFREKEIGEVVNKCFLTIHPLGVSEKIPLSLGCVHGSPYGVEFTWQCNYKGLANFRLFFYGGNGISLPLSTPDPYWNLAYGNICFTLVDFIGRENEYGLKDRLKKEYGEVISVVLEKLDLEKVIELLD